MAAPTDSDLAYYVGADSNPDTGAIGGAIDLTPVLESTPNVLFYKPVITASAQVLRGIAYRKNESTGSLLAPKMWNRAGGLKSSAGGTVRFSSSSGSDTGKVWVCYLVSGDWNVEEVTLNGLSWVSAIQPMDADSDYAFVNELGIPVGDITMQVASATRSVMLATAGAVRGNSFASTLFELAVATALDTALSAADRGTDPTGVTAFSNASSVPGEDNAIALPADLTASKYVGYCGRLNLPANFPRPYGGQLVADFDLIGEPVA